MSNLFVSDVVWRLGWTLLHSLWQLALIGAIIGLALALLSRCSANLRYWLACGGLATMYLPLVFTFAFAPVPPRTPPTLGEIPNDANPIPVKVISTNPDIAEATLPYETLPTATDREARSAPVPNPPAAETVLSLDSDQPAAAPKPDPLRRMISEKASPWMVWIVGFWVLVVGVLSIWNVGGWVIVQRLQSSAIRSSTESIIGRQPRESNHWISVATKKCQARSTRTLKRLLGKPIRFGFWRRPIPNPKKMNVFWGDDEIATLEFFAEEQTFQDVGWQFFEYRVKAYGETGRLKFQSLTNTPCGPILDEISLSLATDK